MTEVSEVLDRLALLADPARLEGKARFGIDTTRAMAISAPQLHKLAKELGRDHGLAARLWATGIHELRLLAALVDDPKQVTEAQMEEWASGFASWDTVDCTCSYLFDRTPFAWDKALEWSKRPEEFVKRAGFTTMATLAVHDKKAPDGKFEPFFQAIAEQACDDRNFVRKAVNWALRQIGKRNLALRERAIEVAEDLRAKDCRAARWIAADALRELTRPKLEERLAARRQP